MIGKPYSGKLNVWFDEGGLEIGHGWAAQALSDERDKNGYALPKLLRQFSTLPVYVPYLWSLLPILFQIDSKQNCYCLSSTFIILIGLPSLLPIKVCFIVLPSSLTILRYLAICLPSFMMFTHQCPGSINV